MLCRVLNVNISLNNPSKSEGLVSGSFWPLSTNFWRNPGKLHNFLVYVDTTVTCVNSKPAGTAEPHQYMGEDLLVGVSGHKQLYRQTTDF
jgi:hypothetical protein